MISGVHLGFEPQEVLALRSDVNEALKKYYGLASDTIDRILTKEPQPAQDRRQLRSMGRRH